MNKPNIITPLDFFLFPGKIELRDVCSILFLKITYHSAFQYQQLFNKDGAGHWFDGQILQYLLELSISLFKWIS